MSIKTIVQMWNEGKTSQQIADAVGKTRNSVIGIIFRNRDKHGLEKRGNDTRAANAKARKAAQKRTVQRRKAKPAGNPVGKPVSRPVGTAVGKGIQIQDLTDKTCRYPIGEPGRPDFHFCGKRPNSSTPYCDTHASLCYNPRERRV